MASLLLSGVGLASAVLAQGTSGTIEGHLTDERGLSLAGSSVSIEDPRTGLTRNAIVDDSGTFRVPGLPIGSYVVKAEALGVTRTVANVGVNVAATTVVDLRIPVAMQAEALIVTTAPPLVDTRDSGVGEIVTQVQIDGLPLNGRQFANLAALTPGVGLGFLINIGKATQFAPQVAGGSGRNVSYLVDGGEHNDGRRGGLSQLFPLESIEEFDLHYRYRTEYGRSSGSVLNVVTKSGRNDLFGSLFGFYRDRALNDRTETERARGLGKAEFRRYQVGGTISGPIVRDRAHLFASFEGVRQNGSFAVDTHGVFPDQDGVADIPLREKLLLVKVTSPFSLRHYGSLRYGFNDNETIIPSADRPPDSWTRITNTYHSLNASLSSVLAAGMLNEFLAQYSQVDNPFTPTSAAPVELFPSGIYHGSELDVNVGVRRLELKEELTINQARHMIKVGLGFVSEPTSRNLHAAARPTFTHARDDPASPITSVALYDSLLPAEAESFPNRQYSTYVQDTLRLRRDLTLEMGVRYDVATGFAIEQTNNVLFQELQAAGRGGLLEGAVGLEDFGQEPGEDRDNLAPRIGFAWDRSAEGQLVVRGGLGRYYDFAYTESTVGRFGITGLGVLTYYASDPGGLRGADGTLFRPGDPLPPRNVAPAFPSNVSTAAAVSPRVKQPYADQANLGFSRMLGDDYVLEMDAIYARGHDLGIDPRLNVFVGPGRRRFRDALPAFGGIDWRVSVSRATSRYAGVTAALKKQWDRHLQFVAAYTLSKSTSVAPNATDETYGFHVVDATDPFGRIQQGPSGTDARHRVDLSGVWKGAGLMLGMVFRYRSSTPYTVITGTDDNGDGANFDLPAGSVTVNQARGSAFRQLDVRLGKRFLLGDSALELIADIFNVFNATNPADFDGNMQSPRFGQPRVFAGDAIVGEARQGEQRQIRFGLRFRFGAGVRGGKV